MTIRDLQNGDNFCSEMREHPGGNGQAAESSPSAVSCNLRLLVRAVLRSWLLRGVLDALLPLLASGHSPLPICLYLPRVVKECVDCGVMVSNTLVSWQLQPEPLGVVKLHRRVSCILRCEADSLRPSAWKWEPGLLYLLLHGEGPEARQGKP